MEKRIASGPPAIEGKHRRRGFTLIELSVSLVIIGLLISSTLAVRDLLQGGRVKTLAADFGAIRVALNAYHDKFHALPGDDFRAVEHLPGTGATPGAGNGMIDGIWNSAGAGDEAHLFWQHVRLANLMPGPTDIAVNDIHPRNLLDGVVGVSSATAEQLQIAGLRGSFQVCSGSIPGKLAKQLDILLDDGDTAGGTMRAVVDGAPLRSPAVATGVIDEGLTYTVCQAF